MSASMKGDTFACRPVSQQLHMCVHMGVCVHLGVCVCVICGRFAQLWQLQLNDFYTLLALKLLFSLFFGCTGR